MTDIERVRASRELLCSILLSLLAKLFVVIHFLESHQIKRICSNTLRFILHSSISCYLKLATHLMHSKNLTNKKQKIFSEKQKGFRDGLLSYSTPQKSEETRGEKKYNMYLCCFLWLKYFASRICLNKI